MTKTTASPHPGASPRGASPATPPATAPLSTAAPAATAPPAPASPAPTGPAARAPRLPRLPRVLRALAIASCLPYLSLKLAWIAGSRIGIPEGSTLLDHRGTMAAANSLTVLMDAAVIVLALLLTRPWGMRVRAWLLAVPMWCATGLLTPIMLGFPLQLLVKVLGGTTNTTADTGGSAFLDAWVFGVVYSGFILQGLALGALFVRYARERWGHLWRGRVGELPEGPGRPAQRAVAAAATVLALLPAGMHLLWACGVSAGLGSAEAADRTSDFFALQAVDLVLVVAAVAGGWVLAFQRGRALPVRLPLALAWVGSGAVTCWGGWLSLASLGGVDDIAKRPTDLMNLTYAVQMIVGMLIVTIGAHFFAERSAATSAPGSPEGTPSTATSAAGSAPAGRPV